MFCRRLRSKVVQGEEATVISAEGFAGLGAGTERAGSAVTNTPDDVGARGRASPSTSAGADAGAGAGAGAVDDSLEDSMILVGRLKTQAEQFHKNKAYSEAMYYYNKLEAHLALLSTTAAGKGDKVDVNHVGDGNTDTADERAETQIDAIRAEVQVGRDTVHQLMKSDTDDSNFDRILMHYKVPLLLLAGGGWRAVFVRCRTSWLFFFCMCERLS